MIRVLTCVTLILFGIGIWLFSRTDTTMPVKYIESFAHQKVQEHIRDAAYLRYDPNVLMHTGYANQHIVSGNATAIRIGRESGGRIPNTEFEKISYALVIAVKCARILGECLEVRQIHLRSHTTRKPLI